VKDTRRKAYIAQYGTTETYELDALNRPEELADLLREALDDLKDGKASRKTEAKQRANRDLIDEYAVEAERLWRRKFQSRVKR
jgi:hypothetical protein